MRHAAPGGEPATACPYCERPLTVAMLLATVGGRLAGARRPALALPAVTLAVTPSRFELVPSREPDVVAELRRELARPWLRRRRHAVAGAVAAVLLALTAGAALAASSTAAPATASAPGAARMPHTGSGGAGARP